MSNLFVKGLRPTSLALAILCSAVSTAYASSPVVAQSSVGLNNLSFQFFDLTPNDTTLPSVSFQSTGLISSMAQDWVSDITYTDGLLPSSPIHYVTPSGQASITASSTNVTLQSQITLDQLLSQMPASNPRWLSLAASNETSLNIGYLDPEMFQTFSLSANTVMVVKGSLFMDATLNSTELRRELSEAGYDTWSLQMYEGAIGQFGMAEQLTGGEDGGVLLTQGNLFGASSGPHQSLTHDHEGDTWSYALSTDFEFVITNTGTETMNGVFSLNLMAMPYISLYAELTSTPTPPVVPPVTVPAIPEPSTYALMGLGLIGIMAAARRRRTH